MKASGAPSIGDIVTVMHPKKRTGLVVKARGIEIGIQYFKPSREAGRLWPIDHIWWVHREHVRIISPALQKKFNTPSNLLTFS